MTAKKLLIPFVLASLTGHALVLALTTRFDWTGSPRPETVMTFELEAPFENAAQPDTPPLEETPPAVGVDGREDEALRGKKSRYDTYLLLIRRKIEHHWSYPPQAVSGKKERKAVIRFTIDASGALTGVRVTTTSGSSVLDEGTLAAVRAAAPYAPLPKDFNLTRLHITATFNYQ
ncbi:MAG: TonB family protein [Deltaproteobacteria bacterium]|nr:MAG: TonB family protein [Deltaproteobacteria bacterium]